MSPALLDWVRRLSAVHDQVQLWSGNVDDNLVDGVSLTRLTAYDKSSVLRRLTTWTQFTLKATWRLLHRERHIPLFVVTNPPFMPIAAWVLHAFQGRRYILLEWDIYPQILVVMGLIDSGNIIYRLWRIGHAQALRHADVIITIGNGLADELRRIAGDAELPVSVIPNWVDTDWIRPLPPGKNPFVREHQLEDKLVILYSGNLGSTHSIETILEVARLMADAPDVIFLIIGEGSKRHIVESSIERGTTPNVRLLPLQPAHRLPLSLSSGHIGIVTLQKGYECLSMPSKTYAMMAAGNAILGISQPPNDLEATIRRHECGANFMPDEPVAISVWIRKLMNDHSLLQTLQTRSRQAAVTEFSTSRCVPLLNEKVLSMILGMDDPTISSTFL